MEKSSVDEQRARNARERAELKRMGEEIAAVSARISAAQWKLLSLIREFDARGGWEGALTCAHWLSWRVGLDLGAAREKVRVARALGRLPLIDEAMRSGQLSYSKVRAITRVATEENQEALVHMARNATGSQMERIGRAYRRVLQRLEDGRMQQAPTERWLHTKHLGFGMVSIEAQLPAEEAEVVLKALDAIRYAAKEKLASTAGEPSDGGMPSVPHPTAIEPPGEGTSRAGAISGISGNAGPMDGAEVVASDGEKVGASNGATNAPMNGATADVGIRGVMGSGAMDGGVMDGGAMDGGVMDGGVMDGGVMVGEARDIVVDDDATKDHLTAIRTSEESKAAQEVAAESASPQRRTDAQRSIDRADALVALAESVLHSPDAILASGRPRVEVVVHVDADTLANASEAPPTLEDGTGIDPETARRLSCDAPIVEMVVDQEGHPLDVGRRTRAIPPAMRRALQVRDGGCRFPGCTHRHFVDGHHIEHWAKGGETRLDNLVLLCRTHHRLVHEGGYSVSMEGKEPVFFDPDGTRLDGSPYVPRFHDPIGLDRYAGFLSWLDEQEHAQSIETPPPPDCYPWDFDLCVDVLVQRYAGSPPPLDTDAAMCRRVAPGDARLAA